MFTGLHRQDPWSSQVAGDVSLPGAFVLRVSSSTHAALAALLAESSCPAVLGARVVPVFARAAASQRCTRHTNNTAPRGLLLGSPRITSRHL